MATVPLNHWEGQVAISATAIFDVNPACNRVTIQVDDSANVTASVTTSSDPDDAGALFSAIDFTDANPPHTASFSGPITGIKLVAGGTAVDYVILGTGEV